MVVGVAVVVVVGANVVVDVVVGANVVVVAGSGRTSVGSTVSVVTIVIAGLIVVVDVVVEVVAASSTTTAYWQPLLLVNKYVPNTVSIFDPEKIGSVMSKVHDKET